MTTENTYTNTVLFYPDVIHRARALATSITQAVETHSLVCTENELIILSIALQQLGLNLSHAVLALDRELARRRKAPNPTPEPKP